MVVDVDGPSTEIATGFGSKLSTVGADDGAQRA
jgi:hypothetical protein